MSAPRFIELSLVTDKSSIKGTVSTVGAALKNLSVSGTEIITPTIGHNLNPYADGIIMAPWANRIDRGRWNLEGKELQLEISDARLDNAIHGLVSQANFEIQEQGESHLKLSYRLAASSGYPFELTVSITYQLTENGIAVTQSAVNHSATEAPFVVGSHPMFQISGTPTHELEIKSAARSVNLVNERKIPIKKIETAGTEYDISAWRKLSSCDFDHGFGDLVFDDYGLAHHFLRSTNGSMLDIWQSSEFKYAFIFTPENYHNNADSTPRKAIAIEPQTGPANAFNSKEDLIWLEPGQVFEACWGVEFTPAK